MGICSLGCEMEKKPIVFNFVQLRLFDYNLTDVEIVNNTTAKFILK